MGSLETLQATSTPIETTSSPRISFSADFLDEKSIISISPKPQAEKKDQETGKERSRNTDFEFLSNNSISESMLTPDELFFEGKLLPFWQMQCSEKLNKINLNTTDQHNRKAEGNVEVNNKEEPRISWFLDEDPSPRPPTCTVLWKELLRLKNKRVASTLSPSSSTSSSSSSGSIADQENEGKKETGGGHKEKYVRRVKKGLERTKSVTLRIRPMVNVAICTQGKNNANLPPLFSLKKGKAIQM